MVYLTAIKYFYSPTMLITSEFPGYVSYLTLVTHTRTRTRTRTHALARALTHTHLQSLSSLATHIAYDVHYKISDFHSSCSNYGGLLGFETL